RRRAGHRHRARPGLLLLLPGQPALLLRRHPEVLLVRQRVDTGGALQPGELAIRGPLHVPPLLPPLHTADLAPTRGRRLRRPLQPDARTDARPDRPDTRRRLQLPEHLPTDHSAGQLGRGQRDPRLLAWSRVFGLQLGTLLPHPALPRAAAEPEPAVRGRRAVVPLHLRPDPPGTRRGAAALLGHPAAAQPDRARNPGTTNQPDPRAREPGRSRRARPSEPVALRSLQPVPDRRPEAGRLHEA